MNIWLIKIGEPLPLDGSPRLLRMGILASLLVKEGHDVKWWTSTYDHFQKRQRWQSNKTIEVSANYKINLLYSPGYRKNASLMRLLHDHKIARKFAKHSLVAAKPDLIVVSFPTPDLAKIAVDYAQKNLVPIIVDIRDLWPDALFDLFPKPAQRIERLASRVIDWYNRKVFKRATGIVAISPDYLEWGLRYAQRKIGNNDGVFYMGYPEQSVAPDLKQHARGLWLERGIDEDKFICCFFGNVGRHFDLHPILDAARKLTATGDDRFVFVICGTGSHLDYYRELARDLPNMIFVGWVDYPQIVTLMEISSVGLAPYAATAKMSLPNKPFEYFSEGLPVLSSLRGELETILQADECGITYENNVTSFLDALESMARNPEWRLQMGTNGRRLFEDKFSVSAVYPEMIKFLERCVRKE